MKTQQRNFIVERKSERRRSAAQPSSIWGDTDLKAIARKAEADAPHLFEPVIASTAAEQDRGALTIPRSEPVRSDYNDISREGTSLPTSERGHYAAALQSPHLAIQPSPQPDEKDFVTLPRGVAVGKRKTKTKRNAGASVKFAIALPDAPSAEHLSDGLALLEEENRQLKRLLATHLAEQNAELRRMLARF